MQHLEWCIECAVASGENVAVVKEFVPVKGFEPKEVELEQQEPDEASKGRCHGPAAGSYGN